MNWPQPKNLKSFLSTLTSNYVDVLDEMKYMIFLWTIRWYINCNSSKKKKNVIYEKKNSLSNVYTKIFKRRKVTFTNIMYPASFCL